jgi:hypothetical protein
VVHQVDRDLVLLDVKTLAGVIEDSTQSERFRSAVLVGFAGAALLLAGLGIYGVLAYLMALRTREIGVRIALGARTEQLVTLISARHDARFDRLERGHGLRVGDNQADSHPVIRNRINRPGYLRGDRRDSRGCCSVRMRRIRATRHAGRSCDCAPERLSNAPQPSYCQDVRRIVDDVNSPRGFTSHPELAMK